MLENTVSKGSKNSHHSKIGLSVFLLFIALLFIFASGQAKAQITPESLFDSTPTFLKVDEAFGFDFEQQDGKLIIKWDIAPGYYLYKKQFKTANKNVVIGEASYPPHEQIEDEFFGLSDVFFEDMEMSYPIIQAKQDGSVKIRYQGCAEAGLCYPPTTKVVFLNAYESGVTPPSDAINTSVNKQADTIEFNLTINNDYFVLSESFEVDAILHELGEPTITHSGLGQQFSKNNRVETKLTGDITISYPIIASEEAGVIPDSIELIYIACATEDLCFQPATFNANLSSSNQQVSQSNTTLSDNSTPVSQQFTLADQLLSDQSIFISLGVLMLLGLGLAFTPCVYPMYPILSSIVIGKGKKQIKTSHAFALSFVYVQGMAITYSIIGLVVASAGVQFQAALQHPVLLTIFIILFIALALAMFGMYEIQLPNKWQQKLNSLSDGQKQGNYVGVFIMGVVSGLVASPCTTAPLTAVLIVVAQSDSLVFGFSALYALSIGMGIPLILFGITGGKLLPKAGAWMNVVKVTFGFMMLTVAILFVERFIIADWTNLLWAALGLGLFTYWYTVNQATTTTFAKGVRTLLSISGLVVSVLFTVQTLQKLDVIPTIIAGSNSVSYSQQVEHLSHPEFMVVRDLADFETKLAQANSENKSVMLDLYADWCVACKEFEKYTFPDPRVVDALSETVWMQVDLTDNTPNNLEFQDAFNVIGLPTIMFFNQQGNELSRSRVTGFMKADAFAEHAKNTLPKS